MNKYKQAHSSSRNYTPWGNEHNAFNGVYQVCLIVSKKPSEEVKQQEGPPNGLHSSKHCSDRFYTSLYRTSPWTCTSANSGEIHDCHLTKSLILRSWLSGRSTSSWSGFQTHSLWMKRPRTSTKPPQRTSFWGYYTRGTYSGPLGMGTWKAINGKHLNAAMCVRQMWKCLQPLLWL